jgi:hypothetical protein
MTGFKPVWDLPGKSFTIFPGMFFDIYAGILLIHHRNRAKFRAVNDRFL